MRWWLRDNENKSPAHHVWCKYKNPLVPPTRPLGVTEQVGVVLCHLLRAWNADRAKWTMTSMVSETVQCQGVSGSSGWSHTCVLCHAAVQTSRGKVLLPVAAETRLRGVSCAVIRCAAALLSHQGIGRIKELSVRHGLGRKNECQWQQRSFISMYFYVSDIHLAIGAQLHTFQRGEQVNSHHGGQSLSLNLQLGITVHKETYLCDLQHMLQTHCPLLRMTWITQRMMET